MTRLSKYRLDFEGLRAMRGTIALLIGIGAAGYVAGSWIKTRPAASDVDKVALAVARSVSDGQKALADSLGAVRTDLRAALDGDRGDKKRIEAKVDRATREIAKLRNEVAGVPSKDWIAGWQKEAFREIRGAIEEGREDRARMKERIEKLEKGKGKR